MAVGRARIWGGISALLVAAAALAVVFSVDSALAQEDRGTERARAAGQPPCDQVIPLVPNQFPAWSNGAGWDDPSYYSTIQLADVDGDGRAELLARGPGGITTSRFDVDTGVWLVLDTTGPFTDKQGWADPSLYRTIQLADIDGQPGAEMIGRGKDALWTIKWDNATNSWKGVGQDRLMSDSDGWGDPSGYSTIQLADIDGQPGAELLGRRPGSGANGGIYEYKWNGSSWQQLGFNQLMSDAFGWGDPMYYSTIQLADIDEKPGAELLARGTSGVQTLKWGGNGWVDEGTTHVFADPQGGTTPDVYRTIQTADVDGDGHAELLGRYPDDSGIKVFDWNDSSSSWQFESGLQGFQTSDAWNQPEYYRTIQTADIDGDGQAELLYRDASGLKTSHYDKTEKVWSQPQGPAIPGFSDHYGFNLAQSYLTIQAADVAGGKRAEVLARSVGGIETLRTNTPAPAIDPNFQPTIEPGFTDYSGDPKLLAAYQYIGQHTLLDRSTSDVRSKYDDLPWADVWLLAAEDLRKMLDAGQTPVGLDPAAFKTVATQLETEFSYVDDLNTWSVLLNDLFGQIFVENIFSSITVPAWMKLTDADNDTGTVLEILELISEFVSDLSGLGGEEGEVGGLVASLVSTSMETAVDNLPGPPSIDATVAQLQGDLQTQGQHTRAAAGCVQEAFARSWALLKALGKPIDDGQLEWTDTQTTAMVDAADRGYELVLWQTLTPVKWQVLDETEPSHLQGCTFYPSPPNSYPLDPSGNGYWWQLPNEPAGEVPGLAFFIQDNNCGEAPPQKALSELFDPPPPDGTGLGVPKADPHCGVNGWRIPGSGIVNTACPPPWGTGPPALSSGRSATAGGPPVRAAAMRRGTRLAGRQISALRSSVRAQVQQPRARLPLLRTLRQAASLTARARRTGIPTYMQMAESTLQGFVGKANAHEAGGVSSRLVRRHTAHAHAIRGLLLGARGGRPPRARIAGAKVKVNDSGVGAIRVRCARGAAGPCRGMLRLVRGERVLTRARFRLRPGGARRVGFQLRPSTALALARRGRLTLKAQATTRHRSGRRAAASRRIQLTG